jgi:hypothetical protein
MVSTGRLHGYESLEQARLLLMLDFAGRPRNCYLLTKLVVGSPLPTIPTRVAENPTYRTVIGIHISGNETTPDIVAEVTEPIFC